MIPRQDTALRAFAWRVLTASSLAEKLRPPGEEAERAPASPTLKHPVRPPELPFVPRPPRDPLPSPRGLRTDADRGRILHAMANHELLALELFAWAVVSFDGLPPGVARSFVATMVDEQRHLSAYLARMATTGTAVGAEPVSTFFWDALAPVTEPRSFVAGLSLCLEQANLDFARTWREAFERAGDTDTAAVLGEVYEDEIRHLRTGLSTFRTLGGSDGWAPFVAALVPPLSPARARGAELDREGRRRAGLGADFVAALATAGGSRGRVPRLFVVNPDAEEELAGRPARAVPELGALAMFLAGAEDLVWARRPDPALLDALAARGLPIPGFVTPGDPLPPLQAVVPYAVTPSLCSAFPGHLDPFDPRRVEVHGKAFAARALRDFAPQSTFGLRPDDLGVVCGSLPEVDAALTPGVEHVVKADLSAAGRHRVRLSGPLAGAPEAARRFVVRALGEGPVVVERWLPVAAELSVHAEVLAEDVRVLGVTRFGAHGAVFRGTVIGPLHAGLPQQLVRFLHRDGAEPDGVVAELGRVAAFVGARARALGHRGPLSVDALVVHDAAGYRLKPLSEVNPRLTMSRLALGLARHLAPGAVGVWWFVGPETLERAGLPAAALAALLEERLPRTLVGGRTERGGFATTDRPPGTRVSTWLLVARTFGEVRAALDAVVERAPALAPHLAFVRA